MFFNFSLLFKLLFHMYDYIVVHVRVSSQGEITEIFFREHVWLIHRFPCMVNIHCTVNICYFKKENDCEKWILIYVGDMTALFFLLLLQMLVYRYIYIYIYTVTATSLHIYAWIYMMNADEINQYCIWNLKTCTLYTLYIKSFDIQCLLHNLGS